MGTKGTKNISALIATILLVLLLSACALDVCMDGRHQDVITGRETKARWREETEHIVTTQCNDCGYSIRRHSVSADEFELAFVGDTLVAREEIVAQCAKSRKGGEGGGKI